MVDEYDKSNNISEMLDQDGMRKAGPDLEAINNVDNHIVDETSETNGNTVTYSDADDPNPIDGNSCVSTKEKKESTDHQNAVVNETKKEFDIFYNKRALTKLALTYKLEMFEKNLLIMYNFINVIGYTERVGTVQDADELENTFKMYGFEVEREGNEDLTCTELLRKLDEFDKRDFTEYGCVAVVVMTHGTWDGLLLAKDAHFSENEIINRLKARTKPSLVTKPVVLIIQACRGSNSTEGMKVYSYSDVPIYKDHKEETHHYYLPVEADMLVIHSAYVGKLAFRPKDGTWFIQTLCKKIRELAATEDLESIMIEVKREVAINKEYVINKSKVETEGQYGGIEFHKQVPTVTSTLIRKLYLFKKIDAPFTFVPNGNVMMIKDLSPIHENAQSKGSNECACLLDHLDYFKNLLRIYAAENVNDTQACCLLQQATTGNLQNLNFVRLLVIAISSFLKIKYQQKSHTKFIHWYGDESYSSSLPPDSENISMDGEDLEKENSTYAAAAPLIGAQTIFVAIKKFKIKYAPSILVGLGTYTAIHIAHNFMKK